MSPDTTSSAPASAAPLGAVWSGRETRFGVASEHATAIELCLFTADGAESRVPMARSAPHSWQAAVPGIVPGQLYGYRAHGPWAPVDGHRFNPAKLLVDPCARAIGGIVEWNDVLLGHDPAHGLTAPRPDGRDSAPFVPKCVVVDPAFDWRGDRPPRTPWNRTLIYECHVRGMTMQHPRVPDPLRGTFTGLASDPVIDHLLALGVTAVELLPVHHSSIDRRLAALGLTNYWGYNPINFFAPDARFATAVRGQQVAEFREMVRRLHAAGIEVILDVVYNHTAEEDHRGPTLCLRGLDNAAYYRLDPDDRLRTIDVTGCGNTLDTARPLVRELVLASLRYWVEEMHVDGFRFDLAAVLARDPQRFTADAPLLQAIQADPVVGAVKLIAEPWDLGRDGYHAGEFPPAWSEWNDRYRDTVRRFWTGRGGEVAHLASRLGGSSDLFAASGRGTRASVNFVTCHDGFTLRDLVSYERKHNEANGEDNRDGRSHNHSRNWGVEGPTDSVRIQHLRDRTIRNLLATLAFSQGVPMLSHGDELGRTQLGNNNAYCQDSPVTWMDWNLAPDQSELLAFTREVFRLRRETEYFRRDTFLTHADVSWLRPDGEPMTADDWSNPSSHALGMLLRDHSSPSGSAALLLLNGGGRTIEFMLPLSNEAQSWVLLLSTSGSSRSSQPPFTLSPHTLMLLQGQ